MNKFPANIIFPQIRAAKRYFRIINKYSCHNEIYIDISYFKKKWFGG
jgi:hypothetical protein